MNRAVRRTAAVAAVMVFALLLNLSVTTMFRQQELNNDDRNRRVVDAQFAQDRGTMLAGDVSIATTTEVDDRFEYQRGYPAGPLYAPITGWYAYDFGRSGLEQTYNAELSGTSSDQALDRLVDQLTGSTPKGALVQTTLNPKLQQVAAQALGNYKGAVVALDPKTGAVLAMVTSPSYDPNTLASHDLEAAKAAWTQLNADPNKPLANRAAREIYPPGSTFKLVTATAALENGMAADSTVAAPASLRLPNSSAVLTNQSYCGGAEITITQALQVSCNTAFANLGASVGADKLREQAEKFGFDKSQLADLNGVASRFPENPDAAQTMLSAIGQFDVAATPLQMAMVAAGIVNDGVVQSPYVVSEVRSPDLRVLYRHGPDPRRAMSSQTSAAMQDMMVNVVQRGTGTKAQVQGVRVGGKTGTAQSDPQRPPYAWFVAFATDPDIAIAVFVEDANVERNDIAGGRLAGPIAKAVIEASR